MQKIENLIKNIFKKILSQSVFRTLDKKTFCYSMFNKHWEFVGPEDPNLSAFLVNNILLKTGKLLILKPKLALLSLELEQMKEV